jgi:hypothetical protein
MLLILFDIPNLSFMLNAMGKIRLAETPLRTHVEKKAKIVTPSMGNKTG